MSVNLFADPIERRPPPRKLASWLILALALLLVSGSTSVLAYRLALPTDGWVWSFGTIGSTEEQTYTFIANVLGEPSPLREGDILLAVEGQPTAEILARVQAGQPQRPPKWEAGQTAHYLVQRGGREVALEVPLYGWTLARVVKIVLPNYLLTMSGFFLALCVFGKRPRDWSARVLLLFTAFYAAIFIGTSSGINPGLTEAFTPTVFNVSGFFAFALWGIGMAPSILMLLLVFPTPKQFVQRHPRLSVVVVYGWTPFWCLLLGVQAWIGFTTVAGMMLLSLASAIHTFFATRHPLARAQARWVASGLFVVAATFGLLAAANLGLPLPFFGVLEAFFRVVPVGVLIVPTLVLTFAIAILRYRLYDIDVLIQRTLVYSILTALLALFYLGSSVLLQGLSRQLTGDGQSPLVTVISTLAIAALFNPLRGRSQRFIDRRFFHSRYNAEQVLAGFGTSLRDRDNADLDRLSGELLGVIRETMQPAHLSLWLREPIERAPD